MKKEERSAEDSSSCVTEEHRGDCLISLGITFRILVWFSLEMIKEIHPSRLVVNIIEGSKSSLNYLR